MIPNKDSLVAILGVSDNKSRYSYLAYENLISKQYTNVIGITPKKISLPEIYIVHSLKDVKSPIHTLTLYVRSEKLSPLIEDILKLNPKRIILNPGTENPDLIERATSQGIEIVEGCTLVMLNTNQF